MSQHFASVESSSFLYYRLSHLSLIIDFICDLFVARNNSWMSKKTSKRTKQIHVFTTIEAEGEGLYPVKLA